MTRHFSPAPFLAEYSPFEGQDGRDIPSFRIYDANGDQVAETDSHKPAEIQEADAGLLTAAPMLLAALEQALHALNSAPCFRVRQLETDSYAIAALCGRAIAAARGGMPASLLTTL